MTTLTRIKHYGVRELASNHKKVERREGEKREKKGGKKGKKEKGKEN